MSDPLRLGELVNNGCDALATLRLPKNAVFGVGGVVWALCWGRFVV